MNSARHPGVPAADATGATAVQEPQEPQESQEFQEPKQPQQPPAAYDRGRTVIADRVVEKITAKAVRDAARTDAMGHRLPPVPPGQEEIRQAAKVAAWVDGQTAAVAVTVSLPWPAPVREIARRLRAHIINRVEDLTGLHVAQVDIEVADLPGPAAYRRRVR
ncbi:Asp23/Gls24 family envelope stress response protein [Peterkaempfera bronchialis]|uniref:Asp23/Gls24 family envelope stress response protein n=1 Tax=Peterkaempfera bronchialis TaxID=2126346 RepID=UPI003C306B6D